MLLTDYFDFIDDSVIRIKGTRIDIDLILEAYLSGEFPEVLAARYPSLSLEQVFATLTYYFANQTEIDTYLAEGRRQEDALKLEQRH